jgi:hypothetical protein
LADVRFHELSLPVPALLFSLAMIHACSSSLRTPLLGPHADDAPQVAVEYPPPPARVERLPVDPGAPCVWVDGYWDWVGRRWEWRAGYWATPPEACHYSAPRLQWVDTAEGTLYFTLPRWYRTDVVEKERVKSSASCKVVACTTGSSPAEDAGQYP